MASHMSAPPASRSPFMPYPVPTAERHRYQEGGSFSHKQTKAVAAQGLPMPKHTANTNKSRHSQSVPSRSGPGMPPIVETTSRSYSASVASRYKKDIASYVDQCPFHLFDTETKRNISRSELKQNIARALDRWAEVPLTCNEVMDIIAIVQRASSKVQRPHWKEQAPEILPYVYAAITKNAATTKDAATTKNAAKTEGAAMTKDAAKMKNEAMTKDQLFARRQHACTRLLVMELQSYNTLHARDKLDTASITRRVNALMDEKRRQTQLPSRDQVYEQIKLLGQYAILSHRWYEDPQELTFADAENTLDPRVRAKKAFMKFQGFHEIVTTYYGSRYLWVDSLCIQDAERSKSIPLMFGWYRRAYVCVILNEGGWSSRGWTLQEYLAARRVKVFNLVKLLWRPKGQSGKFDTYERAATITKTYNILHRRMESKDWRVYKPSPHNALHLFHAMNSRQTTIPEDRVYSLIFALNINIDVHYKEGFSRAFYRLQVECLRKSRDRRLLLWHSTHGGASSLKYNSMLAADMNAFDDGQRATIYGEKHRFDGPHVHYKSPAILPDSSVSFDKDGVMHIMVSIHPLPTPQQDIVFASLGTVKDKHVGVLLRPVPERNGIEVRDLYERYKFHSCDSSALSQHDLGAPKWIRIR